jgi:hypothetical protein
MEDHEICQAIHHRRCLQFWYRGGIRTVEPYAYGVSEGGHPVLRAYQIADDRDSHAQGWNLFQAEEIREFTVLEETFQIPREGYMRNDPSMTKIYCEL